MDKSAQSTHITEADPLIAEFGIDSIEYLLGKIRDAVSQSDDQAVAILDSQLRYVEIRLQK